MERILAMQCLPYTKAGRRYTYRLAITMAVYLAFTFIAQWCFHHLHPTGLLVYLLALLPALPLVASLAVVGIYIAEESDEFERSILVQSMLWGLGGALSVATVWGSLEDFAHAPHLSAFYVYVFFWIFMGFSQPIIRLRYQ
jgi:xanthosine utilization system XapX-like protein